MLRTTVSNYESEFATGQILFICKPLSTGLPFLWTTCMSPCLSAILPNTKKKNLNFLFWACFWNSNHYKNLFRVSAFLVRIIADMMVAPPRNLGPSFRHLTCAPTPRVSVCVLLWPSEDGLGAWSCHVHSEGGKCLGVYFCWCGHARTQWLTVLPVNTEKGREELSGPFWEMTTPETLSLGTN